MVLEGTVVEIDPEAGEGFPRGHLSPAEGGEGKDQAHPQKETRNQFSRQGLNAVHFDVSSFFQRSFKVK